MTCHHILVVGKSGQVATALSRLGSRSGLIYHCRGRPSVDLTQPCSVKDALQDDVRPALVVNAAAYTAVDRAETEPDLAYQVNAEGPRHLARICGEAGIPLVHLSTDYVFDGAGRRPYLVDDPIDPQCVYGASKAAGESAIRGSLEEHLIVRTAWVFSEDGSNFVKTMLRLATEMNELKVVADQKGAPTYAGDIALSIDDITGQILNGPGGSVWGTYHVTNGGEATWFQFAQEIFKRAQAFGHPVPGITPIATSEYPTPAKRPAYSVLDTTLVRERYGVALPPWQDALRRCLANVFENRAF